MNIHNYIETSKANGPGCRFVIWTQGCSIRCDGCFNPSTHEFSTNKEVKTSEIVDLILSCDNIEGITISGGEPLDQFEEVLQLVKEVKKKTNLSIVIYSGYESTEILGTFPKKKIIDYIDVLISGKFKKNNVSKLGNIGSANQKHIFITDRYNINDFMSLNCIEYLVSDDGTIHKTGFPTQRVLK